MHWYHLDSHVNQHSLSKYKIQFSNFDWAIQKKLALCRTMFSAPKNDNFVHHSFAATTSIKLYQCLTSISVKFRSSIKLGHFLAAQTIILPLPCLSAWCSFSDMLFDVTLHILSQKFPLMTHQLRECLPEGLCDHVFFLGANVRQNLLFFLVSRDLGLGVLPWWPFLPSCSISVVESWILTWTEASQAYSALDGVLVSCLNTWSSHQCVLGIIFVGWCHGNICTY